MRTPAAIAGLVGGLCWIGADVVDASSGGGLAGALTVLGAVLLAVAVVAAGAGLVSRSATWLRVVVAVCFAALVGSVLQVLRQGGDPEAVDALAGVVAVAVSALLLVRRPPAPQEAPTRQRRGSHAR